MVGFRISAALYTPEARSEYESDSRERLPEIVFEIYEKVFEAFLCVILRC